MGGQMNPSGIRQGYQPTGAQGSVQRGMIGGSPLGGGYMGGQPPWLPTLMNFLQSYRPQAGPPSPGMLPPPQGGFTPMSGAASGMPTPAVDTQPAAPIFNQGQGMMNMFPPQPTDPNRRV